MSSNDYNDYITRLVRTPSAVTTDVPRYGNAPMFFRNSRMMNINSSRETEDIKEDHVDQNKISHAKKKQNHPQFWENVQVFEYEQSSVADDHDGSYVTNGTSSKSTQVCDDVNADANSFIQQRRKGFDFCNWKTFKAH